MALAVTVCAALTLLTGCGTARDLARPERPTGTAPGPPAGAGAGVAHEAAELAERALELLVTAPSVRQTMEMGADGVAESFLTAESHMGREGSCTHTMTVPGEGTVELLSVDGEVWSRFDLLLWQSELGQDAGREAYDRVGGKWLGHGPEDVDAEGFCTVGDRSDFPGSDGFGAPGSEVGMSRTTEDGEPVIVVEEHTEDTSMALTLAGEGEPYVLRIEYAESSGTGGWMTVSFADYGVPVEAEAPSPQEVTTDAELMRIAAEIAQGYSADFV